jgi:hypothetical protein
MVSKTSILVGANAESCSKALLAKKLIANCQNLAPSHANTTRILIAVAGSEADYESALDAVIDAAASEQVAWRHESYLKYGNPNETGWAVPFP